MKNVGLLLPLLFLFAACRREPEPSVTSPPQVQLMVPAGAEAETAKAREAVAAYAGELKAKLTSALAEGGAVGAIEVCHKIAPELAQAHGEKSGLTIRRVTTRMRNPDAEPDAWELQTIGSFADRLRMGASPANLEKAEAATVDGQPVLRYAKAIPVDALCLTCHGQEIAPPIAQKLRDLYPEDNATAYQIGDLRGIFSVLVPMAKTGER
jgi:hypothetical protein